MTVIFRKKDGGLLNLEDPGADILFDFSSFFCETGIFALQNEHAFYLRHLIFT